MSIIRAFLKSNFTYFFYFYRYLKYRMLITFLLSVGVGVLDGFGLAMFIPLLQMLDPETSNESDEDLGKLDFIPDMMNNLGISFNLENVLILILAFFILKGFIKFIQGYYAVIFQQFFIRTIRITNIDLMNTFSFAEFVKSDTGRIQNTFSGEVEKVNQAYKTYIAVLQYSSLVFVYMLLAFLSDPGFAIMVTIGGAATNIIFKILYKKTKILSSKLTIQNHFFQGLLIQHVAYFKYLKASGLNLFYGNKLKKNITDIENSQRKMGVLGAALNGLREPLTILVVVFVIILQLRFFNAGLGTVILSLLFLYRALTFLMALQDQWNRFLSVSGSLENMSNFVEELRSNKEKNGKKIFHELKNQISLNKIYFSYDDKQVLNGVDLKIEKNDTIAIIGESGSGKSTLMYLIAGLLNPTNGSIRIDSNELSEIDKSSFKKRIGYVSQDAPTFNDSIFNNVTFWADKNKVNYDKFFSALKQASIFDYVMELPNQEEDLLGNNGVNLSGGQKQRLAIARELYKDVDMLFLDEATSALDAETETTIQNNIEKLKGEYTIIMIAHRLSTIKKADRIILLEKGKIAAIGSFEELMKSSPQFKRMINLQGLL